MPEELDELDELRELAQGDKPANLVQAQPHEPLIDLDAELPDLEADPNAGGVPIDPMDDKTPIPSDSVHGEYSIDLDPSRKRRR